MRRPALVLLAAVLAMSWGGPLVRYASAPGLAVAAWRVTLSVALIGLVLVVRRAVGRRASGTPGPRGGADALRRPSRRELGLALAAGGFLALHFWSWIESLAYTTVASSVVLVSTQPVWVALLSATFLGERPARSQWVGIGVAVIGAAVIGWGDFGSGREPLLGDLLALAGAVFVAIYYVIGRRLRQGLDLWMYTGTVYGVAAALLLVAAAAHPAVPVVAYPATDWLVFLALAAGPMMIGHTGVNYALRYVPAYLANLALLGEPIGATLLAWWLPGIGERPTVQLVLGGALVLAGIALGARGAFGKRVDRSGHGRPGAAMKNSRGRTG